MLEPLQAGPETVLERAITDAQAGLIPSRELAATLVGSEVVILLVRDPGPQPTSIAPLTVTTPTGFSAVVMFTSVERAKDWSIQTQHPYVLQTRADWVLDVVGEGYGVVVNPGQPISFEMPPQGVAQMRSEQPKGS